MPPRILTDDDVRAHLTPRIAVDAMLTALAAHGHGQLAAPPRISADLSAPGAAAATSAPENTAGPRMIFTAGATPTHFGYRSYDTFREPEFEQVVVAHSAATGAVEAIAVGNLIGPRRTGALGGAAAQLLAGPGPHTVAVVGSGPQARSQLWALCGTLDIAEVRVFSPREERRTRLADHVAQAWGHAARATASAREAVEGASIVVLATSAQEPVIDTAWLEPDVLVHVLGVATQTAAEIPADLLTDALVTADSPAQHLSEAAPLLPPGGGQAIIPLGRFAAGIQHAPVSGRRVYLSRGLAGTEVALLAALAAHLA